MIKYMSKSMMEFVTESHRKSQKVREIVMESDGDVTEIQTFNKDGVAYGVGECKVYFTELGVLDV